MATQKPSKPPTNGDNVPFDGPSPTTYSFIPSHGLTTVLVSVDHSAQFTVHKTLLSNASPFFASALNGPFVEATSNTLALPDQEPAAFEILYTWLYTNHVGRAESYAKHALPGDVALLRALKLADATMTARLATAVYARLCQTFNAGEARMPSEKFIFELYNSNIPLAKLKEYIVAHCGYWVQHDTSENGKDWKKWEWVMKASDLFASEVHRWMIRAMSKDKRFLNEHPRHNEGLNPWKVYPSEWSDDSGTREEGYSKSTIPKKSSLATPSQRKHVSFKEISVSEPIYQRSATSSCSSGLACGRSMKPNYALMSAESSDESDDDDDGS